jgi:hypothetical protein
MQNERAMHEILSTLQTLMAIFILPTQQYAMERTLGHAPQSARTMTPPGVPVALTSATEQRIMRGLDQIAGAMRELVSFQEKVDSGALARETSRIAADVQSALRAFKESMSPERLGAQQRALTKLTESVQGLSEKLAGQDKAAAYSDRIERDLMQLRVLTRDTLVLLEQIANRLPENVEGARNMLSLKVGVHAQVFPGLELEPGEPGARGGEPVRRPGLSELETEPAAAGGRNGERPRHAERPERIERREPAAGPPRSEATPPKIRMARERT